MGRKVTSLSFTIGVIKERRGVRKKALYKKEGEDINSHGSQNT